MRLLCEFMSGQIISLAMGDGCSRMGVRREVVQFCCSIMRALRHKLFDQNRKRVYLRQLCETAAITWRVWRGISFSHRSEG